MEINSLFNLYVGNKKMAIDGQRCHEIFRKLVYVFPKQGKHFWFIFLVHFWLSCDQIKML